MAREVKVAKAEQVETKEEMKVVETTQEGTMAETKVEETRTHLVDEVTHENPN